MCCTVRALPPSAPTVSFHTDGLKKKNRKNNPNKTRTIVKLIAAFRKKEWDRWQDSWLLSSSQNIRHFFLVGEVLEQPVSR